MPPVRVDNSAAGRPTERAREYIAGLCDGLNRRYLAFGPMVPRSARRGPAIGVERARRTPRAAGSRRRSSARLRHRSCDPSPPSSGSSSASSSGSRPACSDTKLQPIQLQRRVERAMESDRVRDGDRTIVPAPVRRPPRRRRPRRAPRGPPDARAPTSPTPPSRSPAATATARRPADGRRSSRTSTVETGDVRRRGDGGESRSRRRRGRSGRRRRPTVPAGRADRGLRRPGPSTHRGRRLREVRPDGSSRIVRRRRPAADDRAGPGQRPRPARRPRVAPPCPARTAGAAPCSWPISAARTARGSTIGGSRRWRSARATGSGSATRSWSSSRSRTA